MTRPQQFFVRLELSYESLLDGNSFLVDDLGFIVA